MTNDTGNMTIEDAANAITELHDVLLFEDETKHAWTFKSCSELVQQDICQAIDFLSLAHHSMVKAQMGHARELAEREVS